MTKTINIFLVLLFLSLVFYACKEQGTPFLSERKITDNTMINGYNGYLKAKAKEDTAIYVGIHYAELQAEIYDISDSLFVGGYGHCWSINQEKPTIKNSKFTFFEVSENDTIYNAKKFEFVSKLYDLELDTPYYARSFVIFVDDRGNIIDTAYNQNILQFRTRIPQDIWFKRPDFQGQARSEAVCFSFDGDIYVGLGYDGVSYLSDFWLYSPDKKVYTNIQAFYKPRKSAVAAVYNDTVVCGTGISATGIERDMWRYDKISNVWQGIDSLPVNCERYDAVAFSINLKNKQRVVVGTGMRNTPLKDFYYYVPEADTPGAPYSAWRPLPDFVGSERSEAVVTVIDNKAIVGLGKGANTYYKDFYVFYPDEGINGAWHYLTEAPIEQGRANAVAFSLTYERNGYTNRILYFATGRDENDSLYNDLWAFNLDQGTWERKSDIREDFLIGPPREGAVGISFTRSHVDFGTLQRGLVGLGRTKDAILNDFWEYLP